LDLAQATGARCRVHTRDVQLTIDQSVQHGGGYAYFGVGSWHCFHHEDAKTRRRKESQKNLVSKSKRRRRAAAENLSWRLFASLRFSGKRGGDAARFTLSC